jgi:aspartate/methionine/tyrosine aminotransferase
MDNHETWAKYNIAETCAASISIQDLENLCEDKSHPPILDTTKKLVYGAIRGTDALRNNLAALYSGRAPVPLPKENILITPGAIAANYLVLYTLLGKGDHVICHYPTYQQLYEVPASFGAEVTLWKAKEEKKWQLDVEDVKAMIKPNTKMIIIK